MSSWRWLLLVTGWGGASLDIQKLFSCSCTSVLASFKQVNQNSNMSSNDSCETNHKVWAATTTKKKNILGNRPGVRWIGSPAKAKIGSKTWAPKITGLRGMVLVESSRKKKQKGSFLFGEKLSEVFFDIKLRNDFFRKSIHSQTQACH